MRNSSKAALSALGVLAAAFVLRGVSAVAQPQTPVFVHVAAVKEITASGGGTSTIVLKVTIDKGYHLQGNNAKDPYIPTTVTIQAPEGVAVGKIIYPPSVKKAFSGETLPVYESKADIKIPITFAKSLKPGNLKLPITLHYQGCNETSCYPPTSLAATVPIKVVAK